MKPTYQIIPIERDIFSIDINLSLLDSNFTNVYAIGINIMCKIETVKELPIKNRRIAIRQILSFLKYLEILFANRNTDLIELPQNKLIQHFNRNTYVNFLKILNELNILKAIPYDNGKYFEWNENGVGKLKRYKFTDEYKNDELCIVVINDDKEIKYEIDGEYEKRFINTIKKTSIDIKSAITDEIKYNKNLDSLRSRLNTLFDLYEKRYIKKGYKVNRIYHSLTNISKVSRKYLHINNKKYNNIDIVNCQPLLLCYYLLKNNLSIDENYIKDCQLGNLYERFLLKGNEYIDYEFVIKNGKILSKNKNVIKIDFDQIGDDKYNECRKNIKLLMYKSIYFDFKPETDIAKIFNIFYPKVYSELKKLYANKETNNNVCKMAGELQNIEAEIFNNIIPKNSKFYFTLFDAIYFTDDSDAGSIMMDILKKFNAYGLVPKMKYNDTINL